MRSRYRFALAFAAIVAALTPLGQAARQVQSPSQTPRFGAAVDFIQVDVSVLDKQRQPIRGLTERDFTVLENGEPQAVTAFTAIDLPDVEDVRAKWMREAPADVFTNQLGERRLFVILLDDRGWGSPLTTREAKKVGRAAVDQIGPNDQAAVVFMQCPQDAEEFTNDRARLYAAVDRFQTCQKLWASPSALTAMTKVANALSTVPERRKTLIYVGNGEAMDIDTINRATSPPRAGGPRGGVPGQALLTDDEEAPPVSLFAQLQDLIRRAQRANVNIYGVNLAGLGTPDAAGHMDSDSQDFTIALSYQTGGRPSVYNNEPAMDVPRIFRENSSYYLLGFKSTNTARDGKLRRLEVKVNREDVEVRARSGYVSPRPVEPPVGRAAASTKTAAPKPMTALDMALDRLVPANELAMTMQAAPFRVDETGKSTLAVTLGVPATQMEGPLELLLSVFGEDGNVVTSQRGAIPASVRSTFDAGSNIQVLSRVDLPPGRYGVRASAYDAVSGKVGSVFATADVPDFTKAPLSLSGVVLEETPAPRSTSTDGLKALLKLTPTVSRAFAPGARVAAFARIYQGGKGASVPLLVTTEILDDHDAVVFSQTDAYDAPRFTTGRVADYRVALPLAQLKPGSHVLNVTVVTNRPAGATSQPTPVQVIRRVPFSVQR